MIGPGLWMRIVGLLYILNGILMGAVRAPVRSAGPEGALALAAQGDPLASFLVDTWVGFGLEVGAIGIALLVASRSPQRALPLVWAVIAIEIARGIVYDLYMLVQGYSPLVYGIWIVVHTAVIVTGVMAFRRLAQDAAPPGPSPATGEARAG